jgi:hypothetical protein
VRSFGRCELLDHLVLNHVRDGMPVVRRQVLAFVSAGDALQ